MDGEPETALGQFGDRQQLPVVEQREILELGRVVAKVVHGADPVDENEIRAGFAVGVGAADGLLELLGGCADAGKIDVRAGVDDERHAGMLAGFIFHIANRTVVILVLAVAAFWFSQGGTRQSAWLLLGVVLLLVVINEWAITPVIEALKARGAQ